MFRVLTLLLLLAGELLADLVSNEIASRYIPYVDEEIFLNTELLASKYQKSRFSTYSNIRSSYRDAFLLTLGGSNVSLAGTPSDPPLIGLCLALDPGHIGGMWADWQERSFRISTDDYLIPEGELVLEVAQLVRKKLEALGAEVILLRDSNYPLNPVPVAD